MKKIYFATLILIAAIAACNNAPENANPPVTATDTSAKDLKVPKEPEAVALMSKSDCGGCHNATAKVVGPSYKDIAAKYPNTPENVSKLSDEILKGSTGVWGSVPMSAHPSLQKADAEKMVGYILSMK